MVDWLANLTEWWNVHRILIMFMLLGALWRRWFGGGLGTLGNVTRIWKYIVLWLFVLGMYYAQGKFRSTNWNMYAVLVLFAIHWALSHGDYYQLLSTAVDQGRIKWIDWTLEKLYGKDGYYNFKGNCTGMLLRYTSTALLVAVALPNAWFLLAGPLTLFAYLVFCKVERPQDRAEYLAGALNFGLLYICIGML